MLPKNVGRRQIPDASTLESRMDCMKITSSYSCAALNNVHLDSLLDDIKCNLRKEQRTVMELNYMTMHSLLTPIQVRALTLLLPCNCPFCCPSRVPCEDSFLQFCSSVPR